MNDYSEWMKLERSTGVTGNSYLACSASTGIALHHPSIGCEFFPERVFRADRAEDFGGRETAYYHALNV